MNERQSGKLLTHLYRFIKDSDIPEIERMIERMMEEGYSKAEIFNNFSFRKGSGKSHASAYANGEHYDGKMKNS